MAADFNRASSCSFPQRLFLAPMPFFFQMCFQSGHSFQVLSTSNTIKGGFEHLITRQSLQISLHPIHVESTYDAAIRLDPIFHIAQVNEET